MAMERQPGFLVYLCGVGTSAIALYGVRVAADHGENIMGWYANGILPVGAMLVGLVSGLGFALGSRFLNVRLTRTYVMGMLTTGLIDYGVATWLTYQNLIETHHVKDGAYSFLQYIQDVCEKMSFKSSGSSTPGSPLGALGYLFKLLEVAGFAGGTMMPAAVLFKMPYCGQCQRYLVSHRTGFVNSGVERKAALSSKQTRAARKTALEQAVQEVIAASHALAARMRGQPLAETVAVVEEAHRAANKGAAAWVAIKLSKCPSRDAHHVAFTMHSTTLDKKKAITAVLVLDKTAAPPAVEAAATAA
jgi:hypothetical protein